MLLIILFAILFCWAYMVEKMGKTAKQQNEA